MKPLQAVLDTNVFVSALRSKRGASYRLFTLLGDPRWQHNVSSALLFEYQEQALALKDEFGLTTEDIKVLLYMIAARSNHQVIYFSWRPSLPDPDDEFILDLAAGAGCQYLVTHNTRDFAAASRLGIAVVTPAEFLKLIEQNV